MRKLIIISFLPLILLFYCYRLSVENRSRKTALVLEYAAFMNYFNRAPGKGAGFLQEMKKSFVLTVVVYPATVADLVNEVNEVILVKGSHAGALRSWGFFHPGRIYLFIPDSVKNFNHGEAGLQRRFSGRGGRFYEYDGPLSVLLSRPVRYQRPFEELLRQNGIMVIRSKNRPLLIGIDEFFLLDRDTGSFCETLPADRKGLKVHLFRKRINALKEMELFYEENTRAVRERSVNAVILPLILTDSRVLPWKVFAPPLAEKLRSMGYPLVRPDQPGAAPEFRYAFLSVYRIITVLLSLALIGTLSPFALPWIFLLSLLLLLWNAGGFILIAAGLAFYLLNDYFIRQSLKGGFGLKETGVYLLFLLLSGIHVSNFLYHPKNALDSSGVPFVKLIYLLPFLLLAVQALRLKKYSLKKVMGSGITVKDYFLISGFFLALLFLLGRSGNVPSGVSSLEQGARRLLESVFFIRPRFKEILGSFFFLSIPVWGRHRTVREHLLFVYAMGLIAVSGTMNSFLHVHTISVYTVLRSLTGWGLGCAAAVSLWFALKAGEYARKNIH